VTLDPDIDTSTAYGKAMAQMVSVFAELERDLIAERTKEALAAAGLRGVALGWPRTMDETVRESIRRSRRRGQSYGAIARRLNRDGVPTPQGGARWYPSTVKAACS
jgi:DNA invertase Pin-like site-specific DNA recombinase